MSRNAAQKTAESFGSGSSYENNSSSTGYSSTGGVFDFYGGMPFQADLSKLGRATPNKKNELRGGERRLMAALLSDGIESYITHCSSLTFLNSGKGEIANESYQWVHTKDYSYVFSFDNVCESLGIDPDYLRLGLSRYLDGVKRKRARGEATAWKKLRRPRKR